MLYYICGDIMNIDVARLKNGIETVININENLNIDVENTEIIALKDVKLVGSITKDIDGYNIDANLSGIMTLPCNVTLKPVEVPFDTEIVGNIEEMLLEIGKNDKKIENSIDIFPIIWENILMEIPMRVVSSDASNMTLEGNGWRLITDEQPSSPNPELEKLKDLFK